MARSRVVSFRFVVCVVLGVMCVSADQAMGAIDPNVRRAIYAANRKGPYLGLVIPNSFELDPLIQSSNYTATSLIIDFAGRRFRFGYIEDHAVILVMTGLSMINAGITTQLLVSYFDVKGVVHYGIAGNADPNRNIGDVVIPQYWAHLALWNWQRYGQGPNDTLALEANGDYTRDVGYLKFAEYTSNISDGSSYDNLLNNIWYQPEEVFPVDGTPEERQHILWVPVDSTYYQLAAKLEDLELVSCLNSTTCLSTKPKVERVERGTSASIYLDNKAYRTFIYDKFNVTPVDMESAAVALICLQQKVPFIIIRALSDLAGGGSAASNEADTFSSLAATNSVNVVIAAIKTPKMAHCPSKTEGSHMTVA